jgi:zinc transporter 1
VNGVFLVALCLSIFLEAIQRFFEPQEVSHPMLVMIVGCFGLASNIVGLFLFHDHGHSHGVEVGHSHSHGHNELGAAEEGHAHSHDTDEVVADERGNVEDVLPQSRVANWPSSKDTKETKQQHRSSGEISFSPNISSSSLVKRTPGQQRQHSRSRSRAYSGLGDIPVHPASFRNEIIAASRLEDVESRSGSGTDTDVDAEEVAVETPPGERTPLLAKPKSNGGHNKRKKSLSSSLHKSHNHAKPKESGKGGHSHSHDLNMRGVFLHVMGDALGNVGVIASALFIWLTDFSWRFYTDPGISLIITVIILCSAIPLCKAASRILLQAVPAGLNIDDIKEDITALPDIVSCHHLHVWQLNDTKLVASLHVQVSFEFKDQGSQRYMQLARQIRKCLHEYGIHSSTIQPEFCCEATHGHRMVDEATRLGNDGADSDSCRESVEVDDDPECLLDCDDECGDGGKCCPPGEVAPPVSGGSKATSSKASSQR